LISIGRHGYHPRRSVVNGPAPRRADTRFSPVFPEASMQPFETIEVETPTVGCDGGDGPLGHPRVYLDVAKTGSVECPYCSRHFVLKAGAPAAAH
jgi:uncharacterized Zn-finger protein